MSTLAVVKHGAIGVSETFVQAHVRYLKPHAVYFGPINHSTAAHIRRTIGEDARSIVVAEYGTTAARLLRHGVVAPIRLVPYFHGFDIFRSAQRARFLGEYKFLVNAAPVVVAASHGIEDALRQATDTRREIEVIPCGADYSMLPPRKALNGRRGLVLIGRLEEKKGFDVAIQGYAHMVRQGFSEPLALVGSGSLEGRLRRLVSDLGVKDFTIWHGDLYHRRAMDILSNARAVVLSSTKGTDGDEEGTPTVMAEAMALDTLIFASDIPAVRPYIRDGYTGFLFDANSSEALASKVLRCLDKTHDIARIVCRARFVALQCLNAKTQSKRLQEVLKSALGIPDRR